MKGGGDYIPIVDVSTPAPVISRETDKKDLWNTAFNATVNIIIELLVLTMLFVLFLADFATKEASRQFPSSQTRGNQFRLAHLFNDYLKADTIPSWLLPIALRQPGNDPTLPLGPIPIPTTGGRVLAEEKTILLRRTLLDLFDRDPENNRVGTHNRWVKNIALTLMIMSIVAVLAAWGVYRATHTNPKDRVNVKNIFLLNFIIFIGAFVLQGVFFVFFSLRYVPVKPSLQLQTFRDSFNESLDEVLDQNKALEEADNPPVSEPIPIAPPTASNFVLFAALVIMVLAVALVVFAAWKKRAFSRVNVFQAGLIGTLFVGLVIVASYFFVQSQYVPQMTKTVSNELAKYLVGNLNLNGVPPQQTGDLRETVNEFLDAELGRLDDVDTKAAANNKQLIRDTAPIAGAVTLTILVLIVVSQLYRNRKLRKAGLARLPWRKFLVALLLVGLVTGVTSILVEFGFATTVFRQYVLINPGRVANREVVNLNASIMKHKNWFVERRCHTQPDSEEEVCANNAFQDLKWVGEFPTRFGQRVGPQFLWDQPRRDEDRETCEIAKVCDFCCEAGPTDVKFGYEPSKNSYSQVNHQHLFVDSKDLDIGQKTTIDCTRSDDSGALDRHPICPNGMWDAERNRCTLEAQEVYCGPVDTLPNNRGFQSSIWKTHFDMPLV